MELKRLAWNAAALRIVTLSLLAGNVFAASISTDTLTRQFFAEGPMKISFLQTTHQYFPPSKAVGRRENEMIVENPETLVNGKPTTQSGALVRLPQGEFIDVVSKMTVVRVQAGKQFRVDAETASSGVKMITAFDGENTRVRIDRNLGAGEVAESVFGGVRQDLLEFSPLDYLKKAEYYSTEFPRKEASVQKSGITYGKEVNGKKYSYVFSDNGDALLRGEARMANSANTEEYSGFVEFENQKLPSSATLSWLGPQNRPLRTVVFSGINYERLSDKQAEDAVKLPPGKNARQLPGYVQQTIEKTSSPAK